MAKIEEFDAVSEVLGAYLHQDWGIEFERADYAVATAVRDASKQQLQAALAQMPHLIEVVGFARTEVEVTSLFVALGISYRPEGDGLQTKDWLQHVLDCMTRELGTRLS